MCFSVNVNLVKEELENRYGATLIDPDNYRPSYYYHAFSLPEMPVICSGSSDKIQLMRWGLIPSATGNLDDAKHIRFKTFNARVESIEDKPSFSSSYKSRRCIIPVKGFFEWQHVGNKKIPWYIYRFDNEIISLAGLYDKWIETNTGAVFSTFSIITTDANIMMAEIHNSAKRMPVILDKSQEKNWIDLLYPDSERYKLLTSHSSEKLKAHTVSPLINDKAADRNTPAVISPYNWPEDNLLFK